MSSSSSKTETFDRVLARVANRFMSASQIEDTRSFVTVREWEALVTEMARLRTVERSRSETDAKLVHGERAEVIGLLRVLWGVCINEKRTELAGNITTLIDRLGFPFAPEPPIKRRISCSRCTQGDGCPEGECRYGEFPSETREDPLASVRWKCPKCTTVNTVTVFLCEGCGQNRPIDVPISPSKTGADRE